MHLLGRPEDRGGVATTLDHARSEGTQRGGAAADRHDIGRGPDQGLLPVPFVGEHGRAPSLEPPVLEPGRDKDVPDRVGGTHAQRPLAVGRAQRPGRGGTEKHSDSLP